MGRKEISHNAMEFATLCHRQGLDLKVEKRKAQPGIYYVDFSVKERIKIRRLKTELDRKGIHYGIRRRGRNTRYISILCKRYTGTEY